MSHRVPFVGRVSQPNRSSASLPGRSTNAKGNMEKLRIFYDKEGQTLTVWFDDPSREFRCKETGEEVILIKDKLGKAIGFERLNITLETEDKGDIPVDTVSI